MFQSVELILGKPGELFLTLLLHPSWPSCPLKSTDNHSELLSLKRSCWIPPVFQCLTCFALILLFHISLCCAKEYYSRLCKYFTEFESHLPNLPTHLPTHQSFFLPQMLIILEVMYCLGLKDTVVNKAFTVSALLSLQSGGGNKQPINKCISKKKIFWIRICAMKEVNGGMWWTITGGWNKDSQRIA